MSDESDFSDENFDDVDINNESEEDDVENNEEEEEEEEEEIEKVQAKFFTKYEKYKISEKPFMIPSSLSRFGLSEIINHFLNLETPVPFDILIDGVLLRTTLKKYLSRKGISSDDTIIDLEYILALDTPTPEGERIHDDWISSISTLSYNKSGRKWCLTGGYDGVVKIWDLNKIQQQFINKQNNENENDEDDYDEDDGTLYELQCHNKPIKSAFFIPTEDGKRGKMLTAGLDHTIKWWKLPPLVITKKNKKNYSKENSAKLLSRYIGHTDQIEEISLNPSNGKQFCSCSFDKTIKFWELNLPSMIQSNDEDEPPKKRRKLNLDQVSVLSLDDHKDSVTSIKWTDKRTCISGSYDKSIRVWDIPSSISTSILIGRKPISCLSVQENTNLILSGHAGDSVIRLWDYRSKEGELIKKQYKSHTGNVSSVNWHPTNEHIFVSGSFDNKVKIWDTRSSFCLFTIDKHDDKVLSTCWNGDDQLLTGGADTILQFHKIAINE
eukprot:TRINITY_DN928_c0_g1_i1.p1 TRINITY_DN928_c0_g1~~TRINITY_DN928_c0_g1_i1.p1  ORF type:complete len:495 (+),score=186.17 TRINITY_DN928_c0_g1_i1:71-1555(+)